MRLPLVLLALTLLLLAGALASAPALADPPDEDPPVIAVETPAAVAPYVPPPARAYEPDRDSIASLADLTREILGYVEGSLGPVGVALLRGSDVLLSVNGDEQLPLASAAKLVLMLAYLEKLQAEDRQPDALEADLLDAMITYSDNASADFFWYALGDAEAMQDYAMRNGVSSFQLVERDWGESLFSAKDVGYLLTRLAAQHLLDEERTQYAFGLLGNVAADQRWGISAGLDLSENGGDVVRLKNGWYPGDQGWHVNSAGLVIPGDGGPPYSLVVLTDAQPSKEYGIETIETIASMVNAYMRREALGPAALR